MPLTIRVHSHSTDDGDHSPDDDHSDEEEEYAGVAVPLDFHSTDSQVADSSSERSAEDEYVHVRSVRHVRADRVRDRVRSRRQSRTSYDESDRDDLNPSDSASRPHTSRPSSTQLSTRTTDLPRASSRRRQTAPEPPPLPRQSRPGPGPVPGAGPGASRIPRDPPRNHSRPRPESFHSESLDHDDYPGGYGIPLPYRTRPPSQWGDMPHYQDRYEPSVMTRDPYYSTNGRGDIMTYRDPLHDEPPNPFAPRGPVDDFDYGRGQPHRPPPMMNRFSLGPAAMVPAQMHQAMMPYRDPYAYDLYQRDPYQRDLYPRDPYWGRRGPPGPERRETPPVLEPAKVPTPVAPPPAPAPPVTPALSVPPAPSPGEERLRKLEDLILAQTAEMKKRAADKELLRLEAERQRVEAERREREAKKEAEEKTANQKLAALESLLIKQNEEAIARERAAEAKQKAAEACAAAKAAREVAERAATDKIAGELKAAADKAKEAAEKAAAAKAEAAEQEAASKAAAAKEAADKEIAAIMAAKEEAEAAKKKAEEEKKKAEDGRAAAEDEADRLKVKPKPEPPIRFKDAVGRKFSFPFALCKEWKGMEGLIKQAFLHVDLIGPHVMEGHYDLIGPDGVIILPSVWNTMIKPDVDVEMQMWPMPELHPAVKDPGHGVELPVMPELRVKKSKVKARVPPPPPPPPPMVGIPGYPMSMPTGLVRKKKKEVPALVRWMGAGPVKSRK